MKNYIWLLILALVLVSGLMYFGRNLKFKPDETKTVGQPETTIQVSPSPATDDLTVPELEDFDQEVQNLDKSINQL